MLIMPPPPRPRLSPGPQPSLSPAEQHLESPVPSAPGALAGGPTQAAPGVRGEEEQWAREIGAQLRRMADDLNALYERRVSAGGRGRRQVGLPAREGGCGPPRQMCGSCCPARRGRAGDRREGGAAGPADPPKGPRRGWHSAGEGLRRLERRGAPGARGRGD